jgi:hypothetical protein
MTAFRAAYSDMKLVKTRQVAQLIFEIPLSDFDAAYEVLGGLPDSSKERWFGIAAIQVPQAKEAPATPGQNAPKPDRAKRDWRDIPPSQQAGIRCDEPVFAAFLREKHPDDWHEAANDAAECVRLICAVESRSMLNDGPYRVIWHQLEKQFSDWLMKERVGA